MSLLVLVPCCCKAEGVNNIHSSRDSISAIAGFPNTGGIYPDKPTGPTPEPFDPPFKGPERVWVHDGFDLYSEKPCLETAKKEPVKNIPVKFDVSNTGAACFSLPIEVPRGIGRMMPSLSVDYNSQTGNGLVGYGCNIGGLSSITRGPRDIWHDGKMHGTSGTADDALYLDCVRLVLRSGNPLSDGAVYVPENDPYLHVTCHGNGQWFDVKMHDGTTVFYGNRGNSRLQANGNDGSLIIYSWYVSETVDANSNNVTYDYGNNGVFFYPTCITYGTNRQHLSFTGNTVKFNYESRPDVCLTNVSGSKGEMAIRLHDIVSCAGDSVFRKYEFNYVCNPVTEKSLLDKVYVRGAGGNLDSRIEALSADWHSGGTKKACRLELSSGRVSGDKLRQIFVSADVNGDGISDIIEIAPSERQTMLGGSLAKSPAVYCIPYLSKSDGNGHVDYVEKPSVDIGYNTNALKGGILAVSSGRGRFADIILPELNTTGNSDIMYLHLLEGSLNGLKDCYVLNPQIRLSARHTEVPLCASADFDGDGKDEIIVVEKSGRNGKYGCTLVRYPPKDGMSDTCRFDIELDSEPCRLFVADFDQDATADIMVVTSRDYRLLLNSCGGNPSQWRSVSGTTVKDADLVEPGDFNGDGIPDVLSCENGMLIVARGDGKGRFIACAGQKTDGMDRRLNKDYSQMTVCDFNGDGKSDVMVNFGNKGGSHALWLQSSDGGFTLVGKGSSADKENARSGRCTVGDFNGDGIAEILNCGNCLSAENTGKQDFYLYSNSFTAETDRLKSVADAFGNRKDIEYASMATGGIYTPSEGSAFPVVDIVPPFCAVSCVTQTNGVAGSNRIKYNYGGMKMHLQGRGLLGADLFMSFNETLGTSSCVKVKERDKNSMLPLSVVTVSKTGSEEAVSQVHFSIYDNGGKSFFSCPTMSVVSDFDGNVTENANEYDVGNGMLLKSVTRFNDGSYSCVEYGDYGKKGGRWLPFSIKTRTKHQDDTDEFVDVTGLDYDDRGNVIKETVHEGTGKALATVVEYDTFGNAVRMHREGNGVAGFTKVNEYDCDGYFVKRAYTVPDSYLVEYEYDPFGNVISEKDLTYGDRALTTSYTYDCYGNRILGVSPTGLPTGTATGWDTEGYGLWYKIEYSTGMPWTKTWFDACSREIRRETIGAGNLKSATETSYDKYGNRSAIKLSSGKLKREKTLEYDKRGRIQSERLSSGSRKFYSYGNRSVTVDDNGRSYTRTFDAAGNLKTARDPVSSVEYSYFSNGKPSRVKSGDCTVSMEYDRAGNRTVLYDPDAGKNTYEYDSEGKLLKHVDGRGVAVENVYDSFGRLCSAAGASGNTCYSRDKLGRVLAMGHDDSWTDFSYDKYGRVLTEMHSTGNGHMMCIAHSYDKAGNVTSEKFSNGLVVNNILDSYGNCVGKSIGDSTVWRLVKDDGLTCTGNLFSDKFKLTSQKSEHGMLLSSALFQGDKDVCRAKYEFDPVKGNLLSRELPGAGYAEKFSFDELDRLMSCNRVKKQIVDIGTGGLAPFQDMEESGVFTNGAVGSVIGGNIRPIPMDFSYGYSSDGNITSSSEHGNYSYSESHPHAVESVENSDKAVSVMPQDIIYNNIGKVDKISEEKGNGEKYDLCYHYGPDNQRSFTELRKDGTLKRTAYFGPGGEDIDEDGILREFRYIGNGLLYYRDGNNDAKILYMFTDHQGSVTNIFDADGECMFSASYSPWGEMHVNRNSIGFIRGYTGHEMLNDFSLIDMNGRVYDPVIGRFLSPDNYVQLPESSQNFNRYSYCLNNPLKYTDASGESILLFGIALGAISGFQKAIISGSNVWRGALLGGLGSAATYGIGSAFGNAGSLGHELLRAGAHGLATGTFASLDGGNFARGFFSGASAAFTGSFAQSLNAGNGSMVTLSAAMGGLSSLAFGGDFFNGVFSGLQIGLLNHLIHGNLYDEQDCINGGELDEVLVWGQRRAGAGIVAAAAAVCTSEEIMSNDVVIGNNGKYYFRNFNNCIFKGNQYVKTRPVKTIPHPKYFGRAISALSEMPSVIYAENVYGVNSREFKRALAVAGGRFLGGEIGSYYGGLTVGTASGIALGSFTSGFGAGFAYVGGEVVGSIGLGWLGTELGGAVAGFMFDLNY